MLAMFITDLMQVIFSSFYLEKCLLICITFIKLFCFAKPRATCMIGTLPPSHIPKPDTYSF